MHKPTHTHTHTHIHTHTHAHTKQTTHSNIYIHTDIQTYTYATGKYKSISKSINLRKRKKKNNSTVPHRVTDRVYVHATQLVDLNKFMNYFGTRLIHIRMTLAIFSHSIPIHSPPLVPSALSASVLYTILIPSPLHHLLFRTGTSSPHSLHTSHFLYLSIILSFSHVLLSSRSRRTFVAPPASPHTSPPTTQFKPPRYRNTLPLSSAILPQRSYSWILNSYSCYLQIADSQRGVCLTSLPTFPPFCTPSPSTLLPYSPSLLFSTHQAS